MRTCRPGRSGRAAYRPGPWTIGRLSRPTQNQVLLGARHGHIEQAVALVRFALLPLFAQRVHVQIVFVFSHRRIAPARAQAHGARKSHHRRIALHALVHGRHEHHRETPDPLAECTVITCTAFTASSGRRIRLARIRLPHCRQFLHESVQRHVRRRGTRLRQEFVDVGRAARPGLGTIAAIVHRFQQQPVEGHVFAPLAPLAGRSRKRASLP